MKKQILIVSLMLCVLAGIVVTAFAVASRIREDDYESSVGKASDPSHEATFLVDGLGSYIHEDYDDVDFIHEGPEDYIRDGVLDSYVFHEGPEDYIFDDYLTPSKDEDNPDYYDETLGR
jgi:hypothetical protein